MRSLEFMMTVGQSHLLPAIFSLTAFKQVSNLKLTVVGNLTSKQVNQILRAGADEYIDENDINYNGRMPNFNWEKKYRSKAWYKQQFIRLCIDRFMSADQVILLDSEVFPFTNWDESRFYEDKGIPRYMYWVSQKRKSEFDYKMYKGAAFLLQYLPEMKDIMQYADSNSYRRHVSGVVLFSPKNVTHLWQRLERETDLERNLDLLFNYNPELSFAEFEFYGLALEYGLFDNVIKTIPYNNLLGWYDNHDDINFNVFKENAMWSMCQNYQLYKTSKKYWDYMIKTAFTLGKDLPIEVENLPKLSTSVFTKLKSKIFNVSYG